MKIKPLLLLCSDAHLRPDKYDTFHAFIQIVDAALAHHVPVVGAGDLIDKQSNRATTIVFLAQQLRRLADAGLEFVYIQGQHEFDAVPWMEISPNAFHLHKTVRTFAGVGFYGLDWQPFGKLQEELAEIPDDATWLVCHQVWANWMGDVAAPQGSFEQIPDSVTHVHTGDLHQWKLEQRKNAGGKKMTVLSTGATTQQKIDEPPSHHYALWWPDGRIEKKTLNSRVMIDSSLMTQDKDLEVFMAELGPTLESAYQKAAAMDLPEAMHRPYLRVNFNARLPDVVRRVEKAVKDRAILHFKQVIPEEKQAAYKAAKAAKGDAVTPLSVLHEEVDKEERPAVYELVSRLLEAPDKEMEFAKWRTETLGEDAAG